MSQHTFVLSSGIVTCHCYAEHNLKGDEDHSLPWNLHMPIRNNVIYILKYSLKHYVLLYKDTLEKTSGAQSSSGTNIKISLIF